MIVYTLCDVNDATYDSFLSAASISIQNTGSNNLVSVNTNDLNNQSIVKFLCLTGNGNWVNYNCIIKQLTLASAKTITNNNWSTNIEI